MSAGKDRRRAERLDTTLNVSVRFLPDGTPIRGSGVEVGPNGMRLITSMPLVEASYLHISFDNASNNTHCEGRVVWTERSAQDNAKYESGIDIQRWGGDVPGAHFLKSLPNTRVKPDRRKVKR
jgi:hypothetical protein